MAAAGDITTRVGERTLSLTNLDKVLYPSVGFTKAEVIDYYLRIAPVMLPHIRDRVMTRLRFPDGVGADRFSFYEKNAPMGTPDWVRRVNVGTSDGIIDYIVADDEAAIVWLANLAALEMHVPQWTVGSATPVKDVINLPELKPRRGEPLADRVVVDLDPGAGMTIVESARAAQNPPMPSALTVASAPPAIMTSASPYSISRPASPMLWLAVEHADTIARFGPL